MCRWNPFPSQREVQEKLLQLGLKVKSPSNILGTRPWRGRLGVRERKPLWSGTMIRPSSSVACIITHILIESEKEGQFWIRDLRGKALLYILLLSCDQLQCGQYGYSIDILERGFDMSMSEAKKGQQEMEWRKPKRKVWQNTNCCTKRPESSYTGGGYTEQGKRQRLYS